jgi:hypothetical protein
MTIPIAHLTTLAVIASAAKQSITECPRDGLPRRYAPRNDELEVVA